MKHPWMKRIGIYMERQRAWGRRVCEGIASFAQTHNDWMLEFVEHEQLTNRERLLAFDGFIARIPDKRTAQAFSRTGKPVADMTCEVYSKSSIFRGVRQDNAAIGQMAAQHFIEHRFANFAFCGYNNTRFSKERQDGFVRSLNQSPSLCPVYTISYDIDNRTRLSEHLDNKGRNAAKLCGWLRDLPKPCAIFCANDTLAYRVFMGCRAAGLSIPTDIALLGVDNDTLICNFMTPTLSSIDPDAFGLGIAAAELLDKHISDSAANEEPSRIAPRELIVRGSSQTFPVNPSWLSDALIFIHQNVHRHLSAADVHAHLKLSHTRVDTVFRNRLGTTIQKEIRRTSLSEAERMLRLTDIPVAEIAKRTGFASPQYFCNSFTAYYGLSPSAWRERG